MVGSYGTLYTKFCHTAEITQKICPRMLRKIASISLLLLQIADTHSMSSYSSLTGSLTTPGVAFAGTSSLASSSVPMIPSNCELNLCNDSSSPTLSDSGISVDAASSSSSARGTAAAEAAMNHRALTNALSLSGASGMLFVLFLARLLRCLCFTCRYLFDSRHLHCRHWHMFNLPSVIRQCQLGITSPAVL